MSVSEIANKINRALSEFAGLEGDELNRALGNAASRNLGAQNLDQNDIRLRPTASGAVEIAELTP